MRRSTTVLGAILIPGCWYSALALHECGHALAAILLGSKRVRVELPLFGFSHTTREPDRHAVLTTVAGLLVGAMIPVIVWFGARSIGCAASRVLQIWAGFALILNGGYAAMDALLKGGDGGQLVRHGVPALLLIACGVLTAAAGLWTWHKLDRATPAGRADTVTASSLLLAGILSFLIW